MHAKNNRGFTLVEVITVLCVAGILAAMATPFFSKIRPNARLRAAAMDLHSNMQKMRIQAIRTRKSTAVIFEDGKYTTCFDYDESSKTCTGNEKETLFEDYGSVTYGKGGATGGVDGESIPSAFKSFSDYDGTSLVFDKTGLCNCGSVYLENKYQDNAFAITALSSGIVRNFQWRGGSEWN